jgi:hypothetical protein
LRAFETTHPHEKPTTFWNFMASGPVYIPKVYDCRNKTFFRFLYQPVSSYSTAPLTGYVYPTEEIRRGDLNQVVAQQGVNLRNPFTGQPFPNNTIPAGMLSPQAQNAFKYMPLPNFGAPGNLIDNVHGNQVGDIKENNWHFRIDHAITSANTITFNHYRYNREGHEYNTIEPLPTYDDTNPTRMWSIQDTHTFSPRIVNEFLFGRNRQSYITKRTTVEGNALLQELGITDLGGRTTPAGVVGSPNFFTQVWGFQPGTLSGSFSPGEVTYPLFGRTGPDTSRDDPSVWNLKDTVSMNRGTHTIKTGLQISWERPWTESLSTNSWGVYNFTGIFSGSDIGDFLLGLPYTTQIDTSRPRVWSALPTLRRSD